MPFASLSVCREFSAERINAVANHPEVRPWVGGAGPIDMTPVVADLRNVLLMGQGGGLLFVNLDPGLYEVHTQFVPEARGPQALLAVLDALRWMFTRTDCMEIVTRVPDGNLAAAALVKKIGGEFQFYRPHVWQTDHGLVGVKYYAQTLNSWVLKTDELAQVGDWFHEKLAAAKVAQGSAAPIHDDDDAHDRYVGAAAEMIVNGQVAKGISFYNRWAKFSGYATVSLIAANPFVIDIQDALLAVRGHDLEVLLCR
jgi:hypothetical protein